MQDRPSAKELLDAAAELLFAQVAQWVPPERRFQVLIAANVCAVVGRELEGAAEADRADAELFAALLGVDQGDPRELAAELSRRLRAGQLDDRIEALAEGLAEHVRRKLGIARPGYDTQAG